MRRHLIQLLVLPALLVCVYSANAQSDHFYFFNDKQDSVPIWTKQFSDSLTKQFELKGKGFSAPLWPNQQQKEFLPQYPYPQYFNDPRLPGIPLPDLRNQRNNEPSPRVIPRRRDGIEIPKFPGWRIEKLKNFAKA